MGFEITFLGASGGPVEGTTCSLLLKADDISYAEIINNNSLDDLVCIDAGSGLFALTQLIDNPLRNGHNRLLKCYEDALPLQDYCEAQISFPFTGLCEKNSSPFTISMQIFNCLRNYLITHPHMDHIASLVINSAAFSSKSPRNVYGSQYTVRSLKKHIFNGIIWPDLTKDDMIRLHERSFWESFSINNGRYNIEMLDLSHGELCSNDDPIVLDDTLDNCVHSMKTYVSSAFLLTDTRQRESVLVFGDFESDINSGLTKNNRIWNHIASRIVSGNPKLKAIVLECSNCITIAELYGHLMPSHLIFELKELNKICHRLNPDLQYPLSTIHIIINHVKETPNSPHDPRRKILHELNELNRKEDLGVKFSIALSGETFLI